MGVVKGRPANRVVTLPAPVRGLNLISAITGMKPGDALILDNYFPEASWVSLRGGRTSHKTGFAAAVETLMEYSSTTSKLFAAAGASIFDATSLGAIGAAVVTGLTNARWQHIQFSTTAGDYLVLVNGADGLRTFDGTTWATQAVTVATAASFVDVAVFKNRLWFTYNNSTSAWYLPSGAIAGAAVEFDVGPVFRYGGNLAFIVPISFNAGAGFDQSLCFVSTNGEVALYTGTDPASASTFALSGVFRIGTPVRQRGYVRYGGDALVLTQDGLVSMLDAMRLDRVQAPNAAISYNINPVLTDQIIAQSGTFGWQLIVYGKGTRLLINAPQANALYHQWAMNTLTKGWGRFKDQNAVCWGFLSDNLYCAIGTTVYRADTGSSDAGAAISGEVKWAFSVMGTQALKRTAMLRPHLTSNGAPSFAIGINVDFSDQPPTDVPSAAPLTVGLWGDPWGFIWGGGNNTVRQWTAVSGLGIWLAPRIASTTTGYDIKINAIDVMYEPAGRITAA